MAKGKKRTTPKTGSAANWAAYKPAPEYKEVKVTLTGRQPKRIKYLPVKVTLLNPPRKVKYKPVVDRKAMDVAAEEIYQANLRAQAEDILRSWGKPEKKRKAKRRRKHARIHLAPPMFQLSQNWRGM